MHGGKSDAAAVKAGSPICMFRQPWVLHCCKILMASTSVVWCGRVSGLAPLLSLQGWRGRPGSQAQPRAVTFQSLTQGGALRNVKAHQSSDGSGFVGAQAAGDELDAEFASMLSQLANWKDRYYECIVPRKVHDASDLGEWVHSMRAARKRGTLLPAQQAALDALGFAWEVDVVTAKWYHNLHAARHYKEVHGTGELPPDLADPSGQHPDWVEAARWLERQRDLYRRQKLLLVRVRLIKEVLGVKLQRERGPQRRNLHPVLRSGNATFRAEQRQRQRRRQQATNEQSLEQAAARLPPQ
ncbi:hypothetical protein ABPG77_002390 [Micractinium sp. CCAP 211/92]